MASRGLCAQHRGLAAHGKWIAPPRFLPGALSIPLRRKAPTGYCVCLMGDLFHADVTDEQIAAVFGVMAACPSHRFYVLTRRAERMGRWGAHWYRPGAVADAVITFGERHPDAGLPLYLPRDTPWPLPNVWLGVSVENQAAADERIPALLRTPAAVRWASVEPMLGPVDLNGNGGTGLSWLVCGGESGPHARPMAVEWAAALRDQCRAAGVAYFQKQFSGVGGRAVSDPAAFPPGEWPREWPEPRP